MCTNHHRFNNPWFFPVLLALASVILLFCGLSVRSLWGPEGRWAAIVREMIITGDFFRPTINGQLYFDKPLLSYWTMIPFALMGGLNEAMLRIPGAVSGLATVFITYFVGRRFFGSFSGFIAAALMLLSPMFLFWSRLISAEMMNTLAVWGMLWSFFAARDSGSKASIVLIYLIAAPAAFFKGPVAPAVAFFAMLLSSSAESVMAARDGKRGDRKVKDIFLKEFLWIFSKPALYGILAGTTLFAVLLLLPVVVTGSWTSVQLMWRENVTRFFLPFDHEDPAYAYSWAVLLFCAPWSCIMPAALWRWKLAWKDVRARRVLEVALAILLFYVLSGSRRGYYILPLIPALAIITGNAVKTWIENSKGRFSAVGIGMAVTAGVLFLAGCTLLYIYFGLSAYRHASEIPLAMLAIASGAVVFFFLAKQKRLMALYVFMAFIFVLNLWGATIASGIGERDRTLKEFVSRAKKEIDKVGAENLVLFRAGTAEFLFYLNTPGTLYNVITVDQIEAFRKKHPRALLVFDMNDTIPELEAYLKDTTPLVVQRTVDGDKGDCFILIRLGEKK